MLRSIRLLPLIGVLAVSCGPPERPLSIVFEARFGDEPLACGDDGGAVTLSDLRFFVHDLRLLAADGRVAPVELTQVPGWQSTDVALVDLEDGSGACLNGTPAMRAAVTGRAPPGDWSALAFTLGVPEHLNHGDPLTAEPPLTNTAMHWHWRSGYKFLRAGVITADGGFWLHLGSARCRGVIGRLEGCDAANRATVVLERISPAGGLVVLDLAQVFAGVDLAAGDVRSCQVGPGEEDCAAVLAALGIDPASGGSIAPAASFRVADPR